jgi:hypothetical protein
MMERSEILATMNALKLYGMKSAYDEIIATAIKREHQPERIVSDLLTSEIAEKQARSIKYQMTIAKLPLAKDVEDFVFDDTGINETLVRDLAAGNFMTTQRNIVHGNRQDPSGHRHCSSLYPQWCAGPLLQCRRSGQQARDRDPGWQARPPGRVYGPQGLHHPR